MGSRRYQSTGKQRVWFSPVLLAVVLLPAFMQTDYTCNRPTGATTLSALEVEALGTNQIDFDTAQRNYDVWLPAGTSSAIVRATATASLSDLHYRLSHDGVLIEGGWLGTGSGEVTLPLEDGLNTVRVSVKAPGEEQSGGATGSYKVRVQVGGSEDPTEGGIDWASPECAS